MSSPAVPFFLPAYVKNSGADVRMSIASAGSCSSCSSENPASCAPASLRTALRASLIALKYGSQVFRYGSSVELKLTNVSKGETLSPTGVFAHTAFEIFSKMGRRVSRMASEPLVATALTILPMSVRLMSWRSTNDHHCRGGRGCDETVTA